MPLENIPGNVDSNTATAAASGVLFLLLKRKEIPWWERILFFAIGTIAAYYGAVGLQLYAGIDGGYSGIVGFTCGLVAIPFANWVVEKAKDPVSFIKQVRAMIGGGKDVK